MTAQVDEGEEFEEVAIRLKKLVNWAIEQKLTQLKEEETEF
jgi:hypothetical protein